MRPVFLLAACAAALIAAPATEGSIRGGRVVVGRSRSSPAAASSGRPQSGSGSRATRTTQVPGVTAERRRSVSVSRATVRRSVTARRNSTTAAATRRSVTWVPGDPRSVASGDADSLGGRPLLTPFGRSLRTVVVVGLAGGVCDVRRDDWRNTLPRALAGFVSHAETVVYAPTIYSTKQCFHCRSGGGGGQTFDCDEWHSRRKDRRSADLLIIIGTGRTNTGRGKAPTNSTRAYPSVNEALRKRWVGRDTVVVMLPVRKLGGLMTNPHGFQMMIPDASFFKPLAPGIADKLALCARPEVPKAKDLMYVARYQGEKGQLNFLQHVEPRLMDGYTVKFFGKGAGGYAQRIRDAAGRRNISAEVSPRHISHERLMLQTCASRGQVHLAQADSHPRAAYEGLYAGNPLLVSRRANLPDALLQQPFVVAVDPADPASLNEGAARFMELVKRDTRQEIAGWLAANAAPRAVYFELCVRIGVCAYEGTPGAGPVWDRTTLGLIDTISGGLALEARGGADGEEGGGAVWSPHSEGEAEDAGERGVGDM